MFLYPDTKDLIELSKDRFYVGIPELSENVSCRKGIESFFPWIRFWR